MPHDSSKPQRRRKFTEEFKRDAAALVIDTGRPITEIARELGLYDSEVRRAIFVWINYYNHRRLHTPCDMRPPVEYEQALEAPDPDAVASPRAA